MATKVLNFDTKHTVCGTSKLSATKGGRHIFNVKIGEDMDNGTIVAIGDLVDGSLDTYKSKNPAGFNGKILGVASNGSYYVQVIAAGDAVLLHNPELIYEEYSTQFQHASNFFNAKDDIVRGYQLEVGDIFELSATGFVTNPPAANKAVTVDNTTKKLVPAV